MQNIISIDINWHVLIYEKINMIYEIKYWIGETRGVQVQVYVLWMCLKFWLVVVVQIKGYRLSNFSALLYPTSDLSIVVVPNMWVGIESKVG